MSSSCPAPADFPGNLYVVSAPSGAGKSSLVKALLELDARLMVSVSHTTRAPRGQEQHGREYWFVPADEFQAMIDRGDFFEWAEVHGNRYGTSRGAIELRLQRGEDVVLEIDYQGARQIKEIFPAAVLIFILPPSWEELLQRLRRSSSSHDGGRMKISTAAGKITQRMVNAREEVAQARHFDYIVVNALFETALFDLKTIVHAQRLKYSTQRRSRPAVFDALQLS